MEQVQSNYQEGTEPMEPQVKAKLENLQTADNQPIQSTHQEGPDGTKGTASQSKEGVHTHNYLSETVIQFLGSPTPNEASNQYSLWDKYSLFLKKGRNRRNRRRTP